MFGKKFKQKQEKIVYAIKGFTPEVGPCTPEVKSSDKIFRVCSCCEKEFSDQRLLEHFFVTICDGIKIKPIKIEKIPLEKSFHLCDVCLKFLRISNVSFSELSWYQIRVYKKQLRIIEKMIGRKLR